MNSANLNRVFLVVLCLACAAPVPLIAQTPGPSPHFDADLAFRTDVNIVAKRFWIALRDNSAQKMHDTIDPDYIAKHELSEDCFSFPELATSNLYAVEIAADEETVMCQIEKGKGTAAIVLLRLVKRGERLFVQPPGPPREDTIVPWLMHARLAT